MRLRRTLPVLYRDSVRWRWRRRYRRHDRIRWRRLSARCVLVQIQRLHLLRQLLLHLRTILNDHRLPSGHRAITALMVLRAARRRRRRRWPLRYYRRRRHTLQHLLHVRRHVRVRVRRWWRRWSGAVTRRRQWRRIREIIWRVLTRQVRMSQHIAQLSRTIRTTATGTAVHRRRRTAAMNVHLALQTRLTHQLRAHRTNA